MLECTIVNSRVEAIDVHNFVRGLDGLPRAAYIRGGLYPGNFEPKERFISTVHSISAGLQLQLVPLYFIIISLVFFYLSRLLF